jgi:hypothetical protein
MAALPPVRWEVGVQSKEFTVCILLLYVSTEHDVALSVASVNSAAEFVSGIPCSSKFSKKI